MSKKQGFVIQIEVLIIVIIAITLLVFLIGRYSAIADKPPISEGEWLTGCETSWSKSCNGVCILNNGSDENLCVSLMLFEKMSGCFNISNNNEGFEMICK